MKRIAVFTSGGDAPAMNAAVVSIARNAAYLGLELIGIKRGFNGLLGKGEDKDNFIRLDLDTVLDIADLPGTYLRTARCDEFLDPQVQYNAAQLLKAKGIEGLIVIGGNGSFAGAGKLCAHGIKCIGIPGTIDNDLSYTEVTLGYDTAVNVCVDAVRAIRATSRSHDRPHVVEVMGRDCGDLALATAEATGAEIVIVPEANWCVDDIANRLNHQIQKGNTRATIVVAEGSWASMEPFDVYEFLHPYGKQVFPGEPMTSNRLASILQRKCGMAEVRSTVVGYTQRGATPTARDSMFAFEAGAMAVQLLYKDQSNLAIGVKGGVTYHCPIDQVLAKEEEKKKQKKNSNFNFNLYNLLNAL